MGGCMTKDNPDWGAVMFSHVSTPPDPEIVGERWRDMWMARLENLRPWVIPWIEHQRRDGYWQHGSVCEDFGRIEIPVYAVNGWADNYAASIPRLLAGLRGPRKGLIGPWAHNFPHDGQPGPAIGWLQEALRWWDHWLKGKDTGIMDEPMLRVWMQDSVPPAASYPERPGRWVAEDRWPSPRIKPRRYALNPGRLAARAGKETPLAICSPQTVGLTAGEIGRYGAGAEFATDQREDDGGSLVFLSDPLPERVEILGEPVVELELASDKPNALVAVRLNDVAPDGRSFRATYGLLNLTHRDSHEHAAPLVPGQRYRVAVPLEAVAHAFPAGHRIAVSISTGDFDHLRRAEPAAPAGAAAARGRRRAAPVRRAGESGADAAQRTAARARLQPHYNARFPDANDDGAAAARLGQDEADGYRPDLRGDRRRVLRDRRRRAGQRALLDALRDGAAARRLAHPHGDAHGIALHLHRFHADGHA
jgi:putative CocE/NonD family hydrolase